MTSHKCNLNVVGSHMKNIYFDEINLNKFHANQCIQSTISAYNQYRTITDIVCMFVHTNSPYSYTRFTYTVHLGLDQPHLLC